MSLGHRSNARKTFYRASFDTERPEGRTYDSMLEASVARDLDILYKSKRVKNVQPQVNFDLFGKNGAKICVHRPDFLVTRLDGVQKIIEAKGEQSDEWKIKRKLFVDNYPHLEYIIVTRENVNYGKVIDMPRSVGPVPPDSYAEDVRKVMQQLK